MGRLNRRVRIDMKRDDSPEMTNDCSMFKKSMEKQSWNCSSIASEYDQKFVDAKILEKIEGKELANNYRTVQRLVSEIVNETTLEVDDLVRRKAVPRQRSHSIAVAAMVKQMLILRGFKEKPWNEKRVAWSSFSFRQQCYPNIHFLVL